MRTTQLIHGFGTQPYTMWLEQSANGSEVQASYVEFAHLLKELTWTTREADVVDGVVIPEETDIDMDTWHRYADLLVAWVSEQTGVAREQLDEAMHPDVYEPYIRYRPSPLPASAPQYAVYHWVPDYGPDGPRQICMVTRYDDFTVFLHRLAQEPSETLVGYAVGLPPSTLAPAGEEAPSCQ